MANFLNTLKSKGQVKNYLLPEALNNRLTPISEHHEEIIRGELFPFIAECLVNGL